MLCAEAARDTKISSRLGLRSSTTRAPQPAARSRISSIEPGQTVVHSRPKPSQRPEPKKTGGSSSGSSNRSVSRWCSALMPSSDPAEHDPPPVDQRHVVRNALDLVEQVRREQDRPPFLGDRADDRRQNLSAHDRVEAGRRLVEDQQFRPECQRGQQARACPLSLRKGLDPGFGIQIELPAELFGVGVVPGRIKGREGSASSRSMRNQSGRSRSSLRYPSRDSTRTGSRTGSSPKTRTVPDLGFQKAQHVLDQRRLAGAVLAD